MPTPIVATDLLNSSAQLCGFLESGETLTPQELADGLLRLQDLIEDWLNQDFTIFSHVNYTYNLSANNGTYTLGPSGNFNINPRPVEIRSGYTSLNGIDYPLLVIGNAEFNTIAIKLLTGSWPKVVGSDGGFPLINLSFWPLPAQNMTVTLNFDVPLTSPVTLADSLSYPPGYAKALRYALAVELGEEFKTPVSVTVQKIAAATLGNIKVGNFYDDVLEFGTEWSTTPQYRNWQVL